MALEDIRRGLAAELAAVLPGGTGTVSPYPIGSPKMPALMVSHVERMTALDFGDGKSFLLIVEAMVPAVFDRVTHQLLDSLVEEVVAAVESDQALTSRLLDNGTVQTGQGAACSSVAFEEYRGALRATAEDGSPALSATWAVQVVTG